MQRIPSKCFILLLIISLDVACANTNKTNKIKGIRKKDVNTKSKAVAERPKRALDDEDRPFWPNRGKKSIAQDIRTYEKENIGNDVNNLNNFKYSRNQEPFGENRGRRGSTSYEIYPDYPEISSEISKEICDDCLMPLSTNARFYKNDVESLTPFWGNRGKRDSSEISDESLTSESVENNDSDRYLEARDRRDDEPFWGNRGRREDAPFWGNRGRRQDSLPFWGNRGRREDTEPFWGNRGRREDKEPFWGNRGKRKEAEPFWPSRGRRKDELKDSILNTLNHVEHNIEDLSRLKRKERLVTLNPFWENQSKNRKMKYLYNGSLRNGNSFISKFSDTRFKISDPNTVHYNKIFAEQPYYILIERNSRSSSEEDPFFISRGKKQNPKNDLLQVDRTRRGAIEEIVKSVRNDPYYIARGKKNNKDAIAGNPDELLKVKELVCAAIDLLSSDKKSLKREFNEKERDRRTILKKLTDKLQIEPYYASRGKKTEESVPDNDNLTNFIDNLATKCN